MPLNLGAGFDPAGGDLLARPQTRLQYLEKALCWTTAYIVLAKKDFALQMPGMAV